MGGSAIILSDRWDAFLLKDPSELCDADKFFQIIFALLTFSISRGAILSQEGDDGRVQRGLSHRLLAYLKSGKSTVTQLSHIKLTLHHWMHRHSPTQEITQKVEETLIAVRNNVQMGWGSTLNHYKNGQMRSDTDIGLAALNIR